MREPDEAIPSGERLVRSIEDDRGLLGEVVQWNALDSQGTSVFRESFLEALDEVYELRAQCVALAGTTPARLERPIGWLTDPAGNKKRLDAPAIPHAPGEHERWLQPRAVDWPDVHIAHAEIRLHPAGVLPQEKSKRLRAEKQLVLTALAERFSPLEDDPGPLG